MSTNSYPCLKVAWRALQARGRSERAFGTIQGRLPQELRHDRIADYVAANRLYVRVLCGSDEFRPDSRRIPETV